MHASTDMSPSSPDRGGTRERGYALLLTSAFVAVAALSTAHHEMWRDELQAWLISRDSTSLFDLVGHLRDERHPGLWYVCLMVLSRVSPSPIAMQVLHVAIATATVWLIARFAPFTRLQRGLCAFGYFSLYEYAVLARNYALGALLLCVACVCISRRPRRNVCAGLALALMAHTSVHGAIVAIALGGGLVMDHLIGHARPGSVHGERARPSWAWLGFVLLALGVLAAIWPLVLPADTGRAATGGFVWHLGYEARRASEVCRFVARAFFPVPNPWADLFWGSHWLESIPRFGWVQLTWLLLVVGWCSLGLLQRPAALLAYTAGTFGLLTFFYCVSIGAARHHGFLFLVFLAVTWIQHSCRPVGSSPFVDRAHALWTKTAGPVLTSILCVQVVGGVIATWKEWGSVFSNGRNAAAFIRSRGLERLPMVGDADYAASTVVGYLGVPAIWYPRSQRFGSFVVWGQGRLHEVSREAVVQDARRLGASAGTPVLLILNGPLPKEWLAPHSLVELAAFSGAMIGDEDFYLYLLSGGPVDSPTVDVPEVRAAPAPPRADRSATERPGPERTAAAGRRGRLRRTRRACAGPAGRATSDLS